MSNLKHFDHVFMPVGDGVYLVKCTNSNKNINNLIMTKPKIKNRKDLIRYSRQASLRRKK